MAVSLLFDGDGFIAGPSLIYSFKHGLVHIREMPQGFHNWAKLKTWQPLLRGSL